MRASGRGERGIGVGSEAQAGLSCGHEQDGFPFVACGRSGNRGPVDGVPQAGAEGLGRQE